MSKIFVKGNNFMRQLGVRGKSKEQDWTPLDLSGKFLRGSATKVLKVEANQGQTCILTSDGILRVTRPDHALGMELR